MFSLRSSVLGLQSYKLFIAESLWFLSCCLRPPWKWDREGAKDVPVQSLGDTMILGEVKF